MKIRRYELVNGNKMAFVDTAECVFAVCDH